MAEGCPPAPEQPRGRGPSDSPLPEVVLGDLGAFWGCLGLFCWQGSVVVGCLGAPLARCLALRICCPSVPSSGHLHLPPSINGVGGSTGDPKRHP